MAINVLTVEQAVVTDDRAEAGRAPWRVVVPWIAGMCIALLVGSWLVWLSAYLQRTSAEEEVRRACRHVMPETADRCFDTVVIQRGGVRR